MRSQRGNLAACVSFHMLADGEDKSFTAPSINGPGYVIYGKHPHFKQQPPTGTHKGVPLYAWAKVCSLVNDRKNRRGVLGVHMAVDTGRRSSSVWRPLIELIRRSFASPALDF